MTGFRVVGLIFGLAICCLAHGQVTEHTTIESYIFDSNSNKGVTRGITWAQTNLRFNPNVSLTLSGYNYGDDNSWDEACLTLADGPSLVRIGRIRTYFGLGSWADLFYNGFNTLPFVRTAQIADELSLYRDDAGVEVTKGGPKLQVQVAALDTDISPGQLLPKGLRNASVRLQTDQGDLVLGLNALVGISSTDSIYGLDLRYTIPRLIITGELMAGVGSDQSSWGYHLDGEYRLPQFPRTQLVARLEQVKYGANYETLSPAWVERKTTLGIRQVVTPNFSLNLNYGWGSGADSSYDYYPALFGWSIRAMFQIHL